MLLLPAFTSPPELNRIHNCDALTLLRAMPSESVNCIVTSPPYYGLRDYQTDGQIGLEDTPEQFVAALVSVFREARRVLRNDGTLWLNLGDSYAGGGNYRGVNSLETLTPKQRSNRGARGLSQALGGKVPEGCKPKDLIGIPWMVAFALRADGWYLRSDIIWCLSGGTRVYARTQKGEIPMTIKDMVRLRPETVQLWNGEKWTQVLVWGETPRPEESLEIELRSGERIGCTKNHEWPTQRGNVRADQLTVGDIIQTCKLPEPCQPKQPAHLDDVVGWLAGLYIAEGSKSDTTIQIAGHVKETGRFQRLCEIAESYHGTCRVHHVGGNKATIHIYGPVLEGILDTYVSGHTAYDKHLDPRCWQRSNSFLRAILDGYLSGDGHFDVKNGRWRIAFTANDNLAADLRTLCARLGLSLRLRRTSHTLNGIKFSGWRGEIRLTRSTHWNNKQSGEIVAIRKSRARKFYDIAVADEPHLFSLASGVLTHNCKPNPMPESVTDRPTKSHEYVFLLTKSASYWYDADAIKESSSDNSHGGGRAHDNRYMQQSGRNDGNSAMGILTMQRNKRSVWTISTKPFKDAHFATFPPDLIEPMILAGCPDKVCVECGAPYERVMSDERQLDNSRPQARRALELFHEKGLTDAHMEAIRAVGLADAGKALSTMDGAGKNTADVQRLADEAKVALGGYYREFTFGKRASMGWQPTCACGNRGLAPDDFEIIDTPTGERIADDPSMIIGRAGMSRPRGDSEGRRPITRYEQRMYAEQLRQSPRRDEMEMVVGSSTFAHYLRTDKSGARPVPADLLEAWIERGWLTRVNVPERRAVETKPGVVYDPFMGSGTTARVAVKLGRQYIGSEINYEYVCMGRDSLRKPFEKTLRKKVEADLSDLPMFSDKTA